MNEHTCIGLIKLSFNLETIRIKLIIDWDVGDNGAPVNKKPRHEHMWVTALYVYYMFLYII